MNCCVFVHFGNDSRLPLPDYCYVSKLATCFDEVIVVTDTREFELFDLPSHVQLRFVQNIGYDFGKFYQIFNELDLERFDRIALVNDSNILLGDLNELIHRGTELDSIFWGAIDSHEKPWFSTHEDNFHIQSHFLVWEKEGFSILQDYLSQPHLKEILEEKDPMILRNKVIDQWEIGLSQFFLKKGFRPNSVFQSKILASRLGKRETLNFTIKTPDALLRRGYPFLKKRFIRKPFSWKNIFIRKRNWKYLIATYGGEHVAKQKWIEYFITSNKSK
jgi:lipopolysaccharide biosynthesis protein